MKKYLVTILVLLILIKPNLGLAQEYTAYEGPSDTEAELENNGEYEENDDGTYEINYIETRDELDPSIFENLESEDEENIENQYQIPGYLNYKSWQFWLLIIILFLIIFILIRLFKKLSKINAEIKRHERYLKNIKTQKRPQISEKDEILYSEPDYE